MSRQGAIAALAIVAMTGMALAQSKPSETPPDSPIDIQRPLAVPGKVMEWFTGSVDHILQGDAPKADASDAPADPKHKHGHRSDAAQ